MQRLHFKQGDALPVVGDVNSTIACGMVAINGKVAKPTHSPRAGEQVEIRWPDGKLEQFKDVKADEQVVYTHDATATKQAAARVEK